MSDARSISPRFAMLLITALVAGMALLHPVSARAQAADWVDIPVSVSLVDGVYFVVVTSEDGTIEALEGDTAGSFGYPLAAACDGRTGDCFTSVLPGAGAIGFEGTDEAVRAALSSLRFRVADDVRLADANIVVSVTANPDPTRDLFFNPSNGHYYEKLSDSTNYVRVEGGVVVQSAPGDGEVAQTTWQAAQLLAGDRTLELGGETYSGYLATVTDSAESSFSTTYVEANNVWFGASDDFEIINAALAEALTGITIDQAAVVSDVATVTTSGAHGFVVGQVVPLSGLAAPFDVLNGVHEVTDVTETTFSFASSGTITAGSVGGSAAFAFADQAASDGFWFWVDGPETGQHFWTRGTFGDDATQSKTSSGVSGERVGERFDAWKDGEPNGDDGGEQFGILNYQCTLPCSSTANWNDFAGDNQNVNSFLVEFGPFPAEVLTSLSTELEFSIPELIPPVYVSNLAITCAPDPVAPSATVTCEITGGDPNIDILWRASLDGAFASQGVTLDEMGRGTFSFVAPAASAGRSITVELVEWAVGTSVAVSGQALPSALPAGGGSDDASPIAFLAAVMAFSLALAVRLRPAWTVR